ncbi:MAG: hypothetical protein FWH51_01950 [Dehalococcoidia bacterium]|nr:hypothetical protein [Dehalococcoidia bacterium]
MAGITVYLYRNGVAECTGGIYGFAVGSDNAVLIGGRRDEASDVIWSISGAGIVSVHTGTGAIDEDHARVSAYGLGREELIMEAEKEYALVFFVYKDGSQMPATAWSLFYEWDALDDKAGALAEFAYACVVTVRLSDLPVYIQA